MYFQKCICIEPTLNFQEFLNKEYFSLSKRIKKENCLTLIHEILIKISRHTTLFERPEQENENTKIMSMRESKVKMTCVECTHNMKIGKQHIVKELCRVAENSL